MCGRHGAPRLGLPLLGLGLLLSLAATECGAAGLRRAAPGRRRGLKTQRKVQHHGSVKASSGGGDNKGRNNRINNLAKKIQSNIQGGRDPRLELVQDYIWPNRARIDTKHKDEVSFLEAKKLSRMDPWAPSPALQGGDFPPPRVPPPLLTSAPAPSVSGQWDYGPEDQASMWAPSPYTGEPSGTPWGETLDVHKSSVRKSSAGRSHKKSRTNQVHAKRTGQDDKQPGFGQPSFGPPGISAIPPPDGTSGLAPGLGNGLASMIMADPNQKPPVANRFAGGFSPRYPAYPAFPPPPGFGPYGYPAPWWALEPTLPPIRIPPGWPQPPADPLKDPPWGGPSPNPRIGRRHRRRRERERERDERRLFRGGPPEYLYPDYGRPGYDFPGYRYPDYGPFPWYAYSPTLPPIRFPRDMPRPPIDPIGQPPRGGPSPAGWMEPTLPPIRIPSGLPAPPQNPLTRPPIGGPSPASWGGFGPSMLGDPYDPYDPYSGGYGMGAYSNKDGPSGEGGFYPPDSPSMVYSAVAQGAATAAQANAEEAAKQAMDSLVEKGLYGGYRPQ